MGWLEYLDRQLVFWTFMAIGLTSGGFLLVTMLLGEVSELFGDLFGGDHDFSGHDTGGDADHGDLHDSDHGGDHGVHGGDIAGIATPSFFSFKFVLAFASGFGTTGAITTFQGYNVLASSGFGILAGFVMAVITYGFVMFLASQQASLNISSTDFIGKDGIVTVDIPENGLGQIIVEVGGTSLSKLAQSVDGKIIRERSAVVVTGNVGQMVLVRAKIAKPLDI